jgi:hypothetical protein
MTTLVALMTFRECVAFVATLTDAVNFYDQRFGIGFTERQKNDLVNSLNAL